MIIIGSPLRRRGASDNGLNCQNSVLSVLRGDRTPTASSPSDSATAADAALLSLQFTMAYKEV